MYVHVSSRQQKDLCVVRSLSLFSVQLSVFISHLPSRISSLYVLRLFHPQHKSILNQLVLILKSPSLTTHSLYPLHFDLFFKV